MQNEICVKGLEGIISTQEELDEFYRKLEQGEKDVKEGRVQSAEKVFAELRRRYQYK